MKITIPYNVFIFIWCLAGIGILGFYFIKDFYQPTYEVTYMTYTQICWFLLFVWYSVSYIKDRRKAKEKSAI